MKYGYIRNRTIDIIYPGQKRPKERRSSNSWKHTKSKQKILGKTMIKKIVTPAGKKHKAQPLHFFSTGQPEIKGGQRKKAILNKQDFKKLLKISFTKQACRDQANKKTVKVMHVVEPEKVFRQKLRALQLTKQKIFKKNERKIK